MDKNLFSQELPYSLNVWFAKQEIKKKFSWKNNCCELDFIPDFGGHMPYCNPYKNEVNYIKKDIINPSFLNAKSCLLPFKLSCNSSNGLKNHRTDCLVFDQNHDLLFSTCSYNNLIEEKVMLKKISLSENDEIFTFNLNVSDGSIEQLNKFITYSNLNLTFVRQEKVIKIFNLASTGLNKFNLIQKYQIKLDQNKFERFFSSSHNELIPSTFLCGSVDETENFLFYELDLESNNILWQFERDLNNENDYCKSLPITLEYTQNHPKHLFYCNSSDIFLVDTRIKNEKSFKKLFNKFVTNSIYRFDKFRLFSRCSLDLNSFLVASDYNLIFGDLRYPNRVLLQWNHMLPSDENNKICFLKTKKNQNQNLITVSNTNCIALITIEKSNFCNIQPTSLHFPLHLPQFIDTYKFSSFSNSNIEDYLLDSKLVGYDFVISENNFRIYQLTQFGDIFYQDYFINENKKNEKNNLINFKYNSNVKIDTVSKIILNNKLKQLENMLDSRLKKKHKEIELLEAYKRRKLNESWWNNVLPEAKKKNKKTISNDFNIYCENTETKKLIDTISQNIGDEEKNSSLIETLKKLFKSDSSDFESNNLLDFNWSKVSYDLLDKWNLIENTTLLNEKTMIENDEMDLSQYI